jgi:hypothetical protein
MNRGNRYRLEADAGRIVAGILAGRRSLLKTARRYRVAYVTFIRFWNAHTTPEQREEVLRRFAARRLVYAKKGRFRKGHRTWNAGMKGTHFSPATEFKPGTLHGRALALLAKCGDVRIRRDKPRGPKSVRLRRRFIKVRSDGPPAYRWVPLARHLWQEAHGPIPPGMLVVYKNGRTLDDRLENYRLVNRADHLALEEILIPGMRERCTENGRKALVAVQSERRAARMAIRALPRNRVRMCVACGWSPKRFAKVRRCKKCGCTVFEKVLVSAEAVA